MSENVDRERVLRKIERVCTCFQQLLKSGLRPTFFLPSSDLPEILEFNGRNGQRFLYVIQVLLNIYVCVKTNTYRTKRDLFYESKHIFGTQAVLDSTVDYITHLLQESRYNLHILATGKGLVIGDLSFKIPINDGDGGETASKSGTVEIDCRKSSVQIPMLPMEVTEIRSSASFILVAEKDATFQCFVDENSHTKLGPCILITAKGYPDYATRVFLFRLQSELNLPVYALVDSDPYGIDIFMIYKYGSLEKRLYDVFDIAIPSLIWLGVYPSEMDRLPIDETAKLVMGDRERNKALQLRHRTESMNETFLTAQLDHLIRVGYKIEIEAVAALGQCYLTESYLKTKLNAMITEMEE